MVLIEEFGVNGEDAIRVGTEAQRLKLGAADISTHTLGAGRGDHMDSDVREVYKERRRNVGNHLAKLQRSCVFDVSSATRAIDAPVQVTSATNQRGTAAMVQSCGMTSLTSSQEIWVDTVASGTTCTQWAIVSSLAFGL